MVRLAITLILTLFTFSLENNISFSLYLLPNYTFYLEGINGIERIETIKVICDNGVSGNFQVQEHLSVHNGVTYFRVILGKTLGPHVSCLIDFQEDFYEIRSPVKIVPEKNPSSEVFDLTYAITKVDETTNDHFDWTDEDLLYEEKYESIINQTNSGIIISKSYTNFLKDNLDSKNIYLTIRPSPARLKTLHYVLKSLDLSLVTNIIITLPKLFRGQERYTIPRKLLRAYPKIILITTSFDIGPIGKILPAVEYISTIRPHAYHKDIFIAIDDTISFGKLMISTMAYLSLIDGHKTAIASTTEDVGKCAIPRYGRPFYVQKKRNSKLWLRPDTLIEANSGVVYRGSHIDFELMKIFTRKDVLPSLTSCYDAEDLVLSFILSFNNIDIARNGYINTNIETYGWNQIRYFDFPDSSNNTELHCPNSKLCYQEMLTHFIDFHSKNLKYKSRHEVIEDFERVYAKIKRLN